MHPVASVSGRARAARSSRGPWKAAASTLQPAAQGHRYTMAPAPNQAGPAPPPRPPHIPQQHPPSPAGASLRPTARPAAAPYSHILTHRPPHAQLHHPHLPHPQLATHTSPRLTPAHPPSTTPPTPLTSPFTATPPLHGAPRMAVAWVKKLIQKSFSSSFFGT